MITRERIYLWVISAPVLCLALLAALLAVVLTRLEIQPEDPSGGVVAVHGFLRGMARQDAKSAALVCLPSRRAEVPALLAGRPEVWGDSWRVPPPRLDDSLGWFVDMGIVGRDSRFRSFRFFLFTTEGGWWISGIHIAGESRSLLPWVDPQSLPVIPEVELRSEPVIRRGPGDLRLVLHLRVRDGEPTVATRGRSALLYVTLSARRMDERDVFTAGAEQPVPLTVDQRWQDFDVEIPLPERPSQSSYQLIIMVRDRRGDMWTEVSSTVVIP